MRTPFSRFIIALAFLLTSSQLFAQKPRVIKFKELERMMGAQNDTTYLFNFFATWCAPCVEEFPRFQKIAREYADRKFRVVFVSLDFLNTYKKQLLPFLKK